MVDFTITSLADRPEFSDVCAAWSFGEWGCYIQGSTLEGFRHNYAERARNKDTLPLVAIAAAEGKPAGMISLKNHDHPDRNDLTPWVNSLYVHKSFQHTGLGRSLFEWIERQARDVFKFDRLYTFTGRSSKVYESYGWQKIGIVRDTMNFHPDGENLLMKTL